MPPISEAWQLGIMVYSGTFSLLVFIFNFVFFRLKNLQQNNMFSVMTLTFEGAFKISCIISNHWIYSTDRNGCSLYLRFLRFKLLYLIGSDAVWSNVKRIWLNISFDYYQRKSADTHGEPWAHVRCKNVLIKHALDWHTGILVKCKPLARITPQWKEEVHLTC